MLENFQTIVRSSLTAIVGNRDQNLFPLSELKALKLQILHYFKIYTRKVNDYLVV